ncbi:uncharacterized protein EI90DRAFT_3138173 [Cantharellus anzutake]|uniref:uncharacterized protein n=1 Tax=Cantharellus anzutake TaxID=1750568 RepID=UPI0019087DDA|nr:uncharacterized protein EI90DRAFT_3138173 [Cantharellus anzutake]KAF8311672.1 hypothetical protein EI90DRAFT_3138173 [Cantharellus anzutake]
MKSFSTELWSGREKLILAFDIGATYSGVAYSHLFPFSPQAVSCVSGWPGQPVHQSENKVPSLAWYDRHGNARLFGAEAATPDAEIRAARGGWSLAKHFKLHLHPGAKSNRLDIALDPLPYGVTLLKIYTDFFTYLFDHARHAFCDRVPDGEFVWSRCSEKVEIVITHPNGWGPTEQTFLRDAAIAAKLVREADAVKRTFFVSEAEAGVHYCIFTNNLAPWLTKNARFVVCDAGGSTVDITVYCVTDTHPYLRLEEVKPSACVQAGGIFVDKVAAQYFLHRFAAKRAKLDENAQIEFVKEAVEDFEGNAKRAFKNSENGAYVRVGSTQVTIGAAGVRRGRMALDGRTIESFFTPSVNKIIASLRLQLKGTECGHILLVGGFGDSQHLAEKLQAEFDRKRCQVVPANDSKSKAVSYGAVIWRAKLAVIRPCKYEFGVVMGRTFNPNDRAHKTRQIRHCADGKDSVAGAWVALVRRGQIVKQGERWHRHFRLYSDVPTSKVGRLSVNILAFTATDRPTPRWAESEDRRLFNGFEYVCTISVNVPDNLQDWKQRQGETGGYWTFDYTVSVMYSDNKGLRASLEWDCGGGRKERSPSVIIPNSLA